MMYMPDCLESVVQLMEADDKKLSQRTYNVTSFSFTPKEIGASIKKIIPSFQLDYKNDFRQQIADSWPKSLDDSIARRDWNWNPKYDLDGMSKDMIEVLKDKYKKEGKI
jgi:threonine 3-dehydrogenase